MSVSVTHLFRISVRTKHMQAPPPWRNLWQRGLHMSDWIGSNVSLLSRCPVPRQTKAPAERNIPSHRGFVRPLGLIFFYQFREPFVFVIGFVPGSGLSFRMDCPSRPDMLRKDVGLPDIQKAPALAPIIAQAFIAWPSGQAPA